MPSYKDYLRSSAYGSTGAHPPVSNVRGGGSLYPQNSVSGTDASQIGIPNLPGGQFNVDLGQAAQPVAQQSGTDSDINEFMGIYQGLSQVDRAVLDAQMGLPFTLTGGSSDSSGSASQQAPAQSNLPARPQLPRQLTSSSSSRPRSYSSASDLRRQSSGPQPFTRVVQNPQAQAQQAQAQQLYQQAIQQQQSQYQDILKRYRSRYKTAEQDIAGLGEDERRDIERRATKMGGKAKQSLAGRGLYNTTILESAQRGVEEDRSRRVADLNRRIANVRLSILPQLSHQELQFMQSHLPNIMQSAQLFQQLGQGGYNVSGVR